MVQQTIVNLVTLRKPKLKLADEMRSDPFWEFGSFGCTRCHQKNVMNPKRIHELRGNVLAFAQPGEGDFRLVYVTPPVKVSHHGSFAELTWEPAEMPLTYESAPVLISNREVSATPALEEMLSGVDRSTTVGSFGSKFRSRRRPLPIEVGQQLVEVYTDFRENGATVAEHYIDALPYQPPLIDNNREQTYRELLA